MYSKEILLTRCIWNNALSYEKRISKFWKAQINIPAMIDWTINDVQIGDKIVFEDFDEKENLVSAVWLRNFVKTTFNHIPVIIVDNHNHVLYFWYEALKQWIISKWINLIHIDQHSDMNINDNKIDINQENDLKYIFEFTNYKCNVWNFIIPAKNSWLINQIIQIRTQYSLENLDNDLTDYILDIDLDFWAPEMDLIDNDLKYKITKKLISKAKLITIATSPFFIDQKIAIEVLKRLF